MRATALGLCLALGGCLPIALVGRFDVASRAENRATCGSSAECDAAWADAVHWVAQRCAFNIRTQTDTVVETEGPLGAPSTAVACRVERNAPPEGGTQLVFAASCGNWFDCLPELDYLQAAFNDDMRAGIEGRRAVTETPPPQTPAPQSRTQ